MASLRCWETSMPPFGCKKLRQVELVLDGGIQRGSFIGVDERGDFIIKNDAGGQSSYSAAHVKLFKEM